MSSVITISTPFNIDLEFKIAPLHKRLLAWMIDIVVIYSFLFVMYMYVVPQLPGQTQVQSLLYIMVGIIGFSYHLILEVIWDGQSLGKKVMGIRVIDMYGKEPSLSQYLLRWVLRIVDFLVTSGAGAILSATFSARSQRIGDLAAGTVVIDQTGNTNLRETIYIELPQQQEEQQAVFPQVMRLTDRDINGIRNLLDTPHSKDTEIYTLQVTYRIKEVLQIETTMEARAFLAQLLRDYNILTRK